MESHYHIFFHSLEPNFNPNCQRCGIRKSDSGRISCEEVREKQEYETLKAAKQRWEYLDAKYGNPL